MELKHQGGHNEESNRGLLIVPYGIETSTGPPAMPAWELLIVPYGIETLFVVLAFLPVHLLIVPYGIETI